MIGTEILLAVLTNMDRNQKIAVFTSNGTFTVPPGVTRVFVTAIAAGNPGSPGGSGMNGSSSKPYCSGDGGNGGDGGSAGQMVIDCPISVTSGQSISVTVGTGNTVFGSYLTLVKGAGQKGGKGGKGGSGTDADASGSVSAPLAPTDYADVFGTGQDGTTPRNYVFGGPGGKGGRGASGLFTGFINGGHGGNGGRGADNIWSQPAAIGGNGEAPLAYDFGAGGGGGGGGGGGSPSVTAGANGGAGGPGNPGILIVRW